jgi:hypothetical protein
MNDRKPEGDQGRTGVLAAIGRYPITVAFFALVFAAAGVAAGYQRTPVYTAESELLVGNLSVSTPAAIPGVVGASETLAGIYARLVDASKVRKAVDEQTNGADASVSATPVPDSPLVKITATSSSKEDAIATADAASVALSKYVKDLDKASGVDPDKIFAKYQKAALDYSEQLATVKQLSQNPAVRTSATARTASTRAAADLQAKKLKLNALQLQYTRALQIRTSNPQANPFAAALSASSDRSSKMQIGGFIGLIAGLAFGAAVATLRASRAARKRG